MKEYDEKTHPLLDRYRAMGVVIDFEVKRGKKDYPRLWDLVKSKLRVWNNYYLVHHFYSTSCYILFYSYYDLYNSNFI